MSDDTELPDLTGLDAAVNAYAVASPAEKAALLAAQIPGGLDDPEGDPQ